MRLVIAYSRSLHYKEFLDLVSGLTLSCYCCPQRPLCDEVIEWLVARHITVSYAFIILAQLSECGKDFILHYLAPTVQRVNLKIIGERKSAAFLEAFARACIQLTHLSFAVVESDYHFPISPGAPGYGVNLMFPLLTSLDAELEYCSDEPFLSRLLLDNAGLEHLSVRVQRPFSVASRRALKSCTLLRSLTLYCTLNDGLLLYILVNKPYLTRVKFCDGLFANSDLSDGPIVELAHMCPLLESLEITSRNTMTDTSLLALSSHCTKLQVFHLKQCGAITDAGVRTFAEGCTHLRIVKFTGCTQLTDAIQQYFAPMVSLTRISASYDGHSPLASPPVSPAYTPASPMYHPSSPA